MTAFALATLFPAFLIALGLAGSTLALTAALFYMTGFLILADRVLPRLGTGHDGEAAEFPAAGWLLRVIAVIGFCLMPTLLVVLATAGPLGFAARLTGGLAFGLWYGHVVVPAAHELIHRGGRADMRLGVALYVAIGFGHHASSHRLVHHRSVATADDPNTARREEGFYAFFRRAWAGSFRAGWLAETQMRARSGMTGPGWSFGLHPYAVYLGGTALIAFAVIGLAGLPGLAVWALIALHAQAQLLLSDYVQHYGLARKILPGGLPEPVGTAHSWNSGAAFSARMMLNAALHSDHHQNPSRSYPALRLGTAKAAPRLPWSLPVACLVALVPPLWHARMRPRLQALDDQVRQA